MTEDADTGGLLITTGQMDILLQSDIGRWTAETIPGSYGSELVIDANGAWTYTADNDHPAIDALNDGETLTEVFTVTWDGGTTTVTITINGVTDPPCFVEGTLVDTPRGPRPVQDLRVGDLVLTRDDGAQPIRWIGATTVEPLADDMTLQPVRLKKDALGAGVPDRDVCVSPMHRVLIRTPQVPLLTGADEVLCPARHLVNGRTVFQADTGPVTYFHLFFDTHQILTSCALESESFFPGHVGLDGFAAATREELFRLFPDLRSLPETYGRTARTVLRGYEARLIGRDLEAGPTRENALGKPSDLPYQHRHAVP